MTETRPTGEQLRFASAATGEHILDAYLEAAEKGGRTLADLLSDIFSDNTGVFRYDIFEFRVNAATRTIEFRVGDFIDTTSGWTPLESGNVINHRGNYASGVSYKQTDLVSYNGSVYICATAHISSTAAPGPNFSLLINAEDIRGPQGIQGIPSEVSASINFVIEGGVNTIGLGNKGEVPIPFACTITSWTMTADQTGSIEIDIQKGSYANFPTTSSITGSAKPTIVSARKASSSTLTGWTTAISANDILTFNVTSATDIRRVSISLRVTRN